MNAIIPTLFCLAPLATAQELSSTPGAPDWSTSWIDYDADGLLDALLIDAAGPAKLRRNAGDGTFVDVTRESGLGELEGVTQAHWEDFDADGNPDLLMVSPSKGTRLFRSTGMGGFEQVGAESGLDFAARIRDARWFDFDRDGALDLSVRTQRAERLFRNEGRGQFQEVSVGLAPSPATIEMDRATSARTQEQEAAAFSSNTTQSSATISGGTLSGSQGTSVRGTTSSPVAASLTCSAGVDDFSNPGSCIPGSTSPMLGMLYPLSNDWFIDSLGSVGLGTTSPTSRLDVDGMIRSRSGGLMFPDGTVQTTATLVGPQGPAGPVGPQGPAGFDANWLINGSDSYVPSGRVGVGVMDPDEKLHVFGGNAKLDRGNSNSGTTRTISVGGARTGNTSAFATITFRNYDNDDGQAEYTGAQVQAFNGNEADGGELRLRTNDGSGLAEAMRITADGDVGVGGVNPQSKLDVDGTIRSRSGGFEFPDGSVQAKAVFEGTQYTSVGVGSFIAENSSRVIRNDLIDGVWVDETNQTSMIAPFHVPDGAKITGYTVHVHDVVASNFRIQLIRKRHGQTNGILYGGLFDATGNSGYFSATNTLNHTVNQAEGSYFFYVFPINGNWPGSKDLAIQNIVVEWTME